MPYRSWCPACVKGKAKDEAHFKKDAQDMGEVPRVSMDYAFVAEEVVKEGEEE